MAANPEKSVTAATAATQLVSRALGAAVIHLTIKAQILAAVAGVPVPANSRLNPVVLEAAEVVAL